MFESIKHKYKKTYYSQKIIEYKDNAKKNMECYERTDRQNQEIRASFTRKTFD